MWTGTFSGLTHPAEFWNHWFIYRNYYSETTL